MEIFLLVGLCALNFYEINSPFCGVWGSYLSMSCEHSWCMNSTTVTYSEFYVFSIVESTNCACIDSSWYSIFAEVWCTHFIPNTSKKLTLQCVHKNNFH
jgi:hypothetical protein